MFLSVVLGHKQDLTDCAENLDKENPSTHAKQRTQYNVNNQVSELMSYSDLQIRGSIALLLRSTVTLYWRGDGALRSSLVFPPIVSHAQSQSRDLPAN